MAAIGYVLCTVLSLPFAISQRVGIEPGPSVNATQGEIWPQPRRIWKVDEILTVDPKNFEFQVVGKTCDILDQAINRYQKIIKAVDKQVRKASRKLNIRNPSRGKSSKKTFRQLSALTVNLQEECEILPHLEMNEEYDLIVCAPNNASTIALKSHSIWGILRGLESFSQLLYADADTQKLLIKRCQISDSPRFPHRGLLLDTSRHFIPLRQIYTLLDGMAMNKLNVFHWHIVDDQSFPFESVHFPELSTKGAYSPLHVYSVMDVANVIEYARLRGIRVVPEFDTPGHTRSWGQAYPDLLTSCYESYGGPDGSLGPMNPLNSFVYSFMESLLTELRVVFKDSYIHLGGDEVNFNCWLSNPDIKMYLQTNNVTVEKLEELYIQKVINMATQQNFTPIVWQEVYDNGANIPTNTIVHVWKDWIDYMSVMAQITLSGHSAILSSCWYLDHLKWGGDWADFYNCDPTAFPGSSEAHKRVLGGEACMWAEVVDTNNALTRVFPRASAAAEKLWSPGVKTLFIAEATARMEEHYCRMNLRGIPAQPPNGPGFCPFQLYE